uniref:Uncharacterized protein n=1 Tax=Streptomyces avermitilis TaxID=33903 RepID=A0A499VXB3_STRAX|nr:hypothetical protein SAVMC3_52350 [Streptomyces avermitilis]
MLPLPLPLPLPLRVWLPLVGSAASVAHSGAISRAVLIGRWPP